MKKLILLFMFIIVASLFGITCYAVDHTGTHTMNMKNDYAVKPSNLTTYDCKYYAGSSFLGLVTKPAEAETFIGVGGYTQGVSEVIMYRPDNTTLQKSDGKVENSKHHSGRAKLKGHSYSPKVVHRGNRRSQSTNAVVDTVFLTFKE